MMEYVIPDLSQKTSDQLHTEVRALVRDFALTPNYSLLNFCLIDGYLVEIDRRRKVRSCL